MEKYCPLCGHLVPFFTPFSGELMKKYIEYGCLGGKFEFELFSTKQFSCPICGGMDRERLVGLYLRNYFSSNNATIDFRLLEFAPRRAIGKFLQKYFTLCHETADLYMDGVDFRLDICSMTQIPDASYNAWICLHVLEHVPDDASAITELYRILKPNGFGLLLVPISLTLPATEEDIDTSEEERWRRFGQGDHVRLYSKRDFASRIRAGGFHLLELGVDFFGAEIFKRCGLPRSSVLYVAIR